MTCSSLFPWYYPLPANKRWRNYFQFLLSSRLCLNEGFVKGKNIQTYLVVSLFFSFLSFSFHTCLVQGSKFRFVSVETVEIFRFSRKPKRNISRITKFQCFHRNISHDLASITMVNDNTLQAASNAEFQEQKVDISKVFADASPTTCHVNHWCLNQLL